MLIPTFLMGGTLPLLVKHFAQHLAQAQSVTSRIYGINTLGATMGAFCAGFLLLPSLGITTTLLSAAAVNIIVGFSVYQLLLRTSLQTHEMPAKKTVAKVNKQPDAIAQPSLLLVGPSRFSSTSRARRMTSGGSPARRATSIP